MHVFLKRTPTLFVIGVTGFVVYTILVPDGNSGQPKVDTKPPAPSKVAIERASNTLRNPFLMDRPIDPVSTRPGQGTSEPPSKEVASKANPGELPALPSEEDKLLQSMKLGGTFVDSHEQLAVIDNKVYARGDQLRAADGSTMPYVITEVRKDRALVRRGRRDFVIAFSDVPRAGALQKPVQDKKTLASKTDARAKFTPIPKGKRGQATPNGKPDGNDSDDQKEMLMKLLTSLGGGNGTGGGSTGSNPLDGLGSGSGLNQSALNSLVNPTNLGAGLDAIMGKNDNIGQGAGTGP
jgi:hypothetical protein